MAQQHGVTPISQPYDPKCGLTQQQYNSFCDVMTETMNLFTQGHLKCPEQMNTYTQIMITTLSGLDSRSYVSLMKLQQLQQNYLILIVI